MLETPFVGRKKELKDLNLLISKKSASLVVVRGRRRIGKSRLIEEFAKDKKFLRFSGIPPTDHVTAQAQRDVFAQQLGKQLGLPGLQAADWADLFTLLASQVREGRVIILFDEISWMGFKDPTFIGKLKNAWDMEFKKNSELILVLCGSVSTWIEQNIIRSTAFFGRISLYLTLEELPLSDCNRLLEVQGFRGSVYEKFKLLSVTGGTPWYLEQIKSKLNADENIKNLCFRKDGILVNEFDLIFHDLFTRRSEIYKKIIEALAKGTLEFNKIHENLNYPKSGVLSEYLADLMSAGFISRDFTWHLKTGKDSRLSHFRLSDNYLRFYLKYVSHNRSKISRDEFNDIIYIQFTWVGYDYGLTI
jgi:AAA+ ATPase superfamily predicted ATPase